jgi:hypothetical protein
MAAESARPTPPRQTPDDPNAGDRQLSDKQKDAFRNEPVPPKQNRGDRLPDPGDVGEAG